MNDKLELNDFRSVFSDGVLGQPSKSIPSENFEFPNLKKIYESLNVNAIKSYLITKLKYVDEKSSIISTESPEDLDNSEFKDCTDIFKISCIPECTEDEKSELEYNYGPVSDDEEECYDAFGPPDETQESDCGDTIINGVERDRNFEEDQSCSVTIGLAKIPIGTPELPHHHVIRLELITQLMKRFRTSKPGMIIVVSGPDCSNNTSSNTNSNTNLTVSNPLKPSGLSGIGKSTLVSSVLRLPEVRLQFNGGIYWLHIGAIVADYSEIELFRIVQQLARRMQIQIHHLAARKKGAVGQGTRTTNSRSPLYSQKNAGNGTQTISGKDFNVSAPYLQQAALSTLDSCCNVIKEIMKYHHHQQQQHNSAADTSNQSIPDNNNSQSELENIRNKGINGTNDVSTATTTHNGGFHSVKESRIHHNDNDSLTTQPTLNHLNNNMNNNNTNTNSSANSCSYLLVLDDVCGDRIVHFFKDLGFTIVITTKHPDLFSSGNMIGSLVTVEDVNIEYGLQILSKSARMIGPQQLPREAYRLLEITRNILELTMLGAMAVERATEPAVWNEIYQKRTSAMLASSTPWIDNYYKNEWMSNDIQRHKGVLVTTKLSLSGLTAYIQDYYLSLLVLPSGYAVDREYLSMLWDISGDYLTAVISLLLMRCLITSETALNHKTRYRLHDLQADCLILHALSQSNKANRRKNRSKSGLSRSALVIQTAVERSISRLTDPMVADLSTNDDGSGSSLHTFSFDCACWKKLELLSDLCLCSPIIPSNSFQQHMDLQMKRCAVSGDMCRYISYACRILEHRGHFHPTLVTWYRTALDFLEREHKGFTLEAANLQNSLGLLLQRIGKYCEAIDIHFKAAMTLENIYGSKHISVALTYANIGTALQALGHVDDAIHMLRKSLFITIETDGVENPTVARTLTNLSHLLAVKGSHCESIAGLEAAVNIFEISLGPNHPESVITSAERGIALLESGEVISGMEMIESSLVTLKRYGFGEEDVYIKRLRGYIRKFSGSEDVCSTCGICRS